MNKLQAAIRRSLDEFARSVQLCPYKLIESENGIEYKNHSNKTIFTVYHQRLDTQNPIEVAIGIDNLINEYPLDIEHALTWLADVQEKHPKASSKSPHFWPRIGLQSLKAARDFELAFLKLTSAKEGATPEDAGIPSSADSPTQPMDEITLQHILTRRGQALFRNGLLAAYNFECAISGCRDEAVLEAAHIVPHSESEDYRITNGLLLRADLHTLFDLHLLSVNPQSGQTVVSIGLSSHYQLFAGNTLKLPEKSIDHPDPIQLMRHFRAWQAKNLGNDQSHSSLPQIK